MKEEILNQLAGVINALNTITVHGKQNLGSLCASITTLEDIGSKLYESEIIVKNKE